MSNLTDLLLQSMPQDDANMDIIDRLKRLRLQADISASNVDGAKGIAGGGRLGLSMPTQDGGFTLGASGGGAYIPKYKVKDFNINRVDANYDSGQNSFGVDFDPNDMRNNFMLNYKRNF